LLNDTRITDNYRVIVFDMPWHWQSSPPEGFQNEEYTLTSRGYIQMIWKSPKRSNSTSRW